MFHTLQDSSIFKRHHFGKETGCLSHFKSHHDGICLTSHLTSESSLFTLFAKEVVDVIEEFIQEQECRDWLVPSAPAVVVPGNPGMQMQRSQKRSEGRDPEVQHQ